MISATTVELIERPSAEFGESIAAASPHAYFTHTPRYLAYCTDANSGLRDASLGFVFGDGQKAYLPLVIINVMRGVWKNFESSSRGYGGLISDGELSAERSRFVFDRALDWMRGRRLSKVTITCCPGSPDLQPLLDVGQRGLFASCERAEAEVLSLPDSLEELMKGYAKGRRSDIKRAERSGIVVRAAQGEQDYRDFFEVYQDRVRRWGEQAKGKYQVNFFLALKRAVDATGDIKLWLAFDEGRVCAGAVVFYHRDKANYWLSASLEDDSKRPNAYLQYRIQEDAIGRGVKTYDMGRSGRPGVKAFKTHFGAVSTEYQVVTIENPSATRMVNILTSLRRVIRR